MEATQKIIVDGSLVVDGGTGPDTQGRGRPSGGAGGTINLKAGISIAGSGVLSAQGGMGGAQLTWAGWRKGGGSGGGGRISVDATDLSEFHPDILSVVGGAARGAYPGYEGTLYRRDQP